MKLIATIATIAFILLLLRLGRDRRAHASWALLIPMLWFAIICSRPVSQWTHLGQSTNLMDRFSETSPLDAGTYAALLAAGLLVLNKRWQRVKAIVQANLPVMLFFFYCFLSLSWSDDPPVAFKRWFKAIGDLVMILVLLTEDDHEWAIRRMYMAIASVMLPLSVLFIVFYPALGTSYDLYDHVTMYTGVATFKNLLGITCMASGLAGLWSFIAAWQDRADPDRKKHLFLYGSIMLMAIGLVLRADSMTSFSSLILAGMVIVVSVFRLPQRRPAIVLVTALAAIGVAGFALFMDTGGGMLHEIGRNATLTGRTTIWRAVLAQKINPFLGAGFESFWMGDRMQSVWSMSQYGIQEAHDGYLEVYLNLGWAGIALLGMMIVTGFRNSLILYRRDPEAGRLRLGLLTAALVFGFTEAGFRMLSPDWTGFLLGVTAIPLALERVVATERTKREAVREATKEKRREVRVLY